jgi:hypothetical protein
MLLHAKMTVAILVPLCPSMLTERMICTGLLHPEWDGMRRFAVGDGPGIEGIELSRDQIDGP